MIKNKIAEQIAAKAAKRPKKITRNAFVYLEPKDDNPYFAQCRSCINWTGKHCLILGKQQYVKAIDSCSLYVPGTPQINRRGEEKELVSPEAAGYVEELVQCQRCSYFNPEDSTCELFKDLMKQEPAKWDLDVKVKAQGCCNAFSPRRKAPE